MLRLRSRANAIDGYDAREWRRTHLVTRAVRTLLAGASLALVVATAAAARAGDTEPDGLLPRETTGVVVIDLSLSITPSEYTLVRRAVRRLVAANERIGLVIFSDVPYELLPPGTPASELQPILRLLSPPSRGDATNPWTQSFRAGTRISTALTLAKRMLERDGVERGSILLLSDLETAPDDVVALSSVVSELRRSGTQLRVLGLAPTSQGRLLFEGLLDRGEFAELGPGKPVEPPKPAARLPLEIMVLGALLLVAIAGHELFASRLAVTRAAGAVHEPA